jgi:hypothetical protein
MKSGYPIYRWNTGFQWIENMPDSKSSSVFKPVLSTYNCNNIKNVGAVANTMGFTLQRLCPISYMYRMIRNEHVNEVHKQEGKMLEIIKSYHLQEK